MKKTLKTVLSVLVVLTLCVGLLAGCNGGNTPAGKWKVTSGLSEEQMADPNLSEMTLNADGSITAGGVTNGTWKLNGDSVTFEQNGISLDYQYDGNTLVFAANGRELVYSRV